MTCQGKKRRHPACGVGVAEVEGPFLAERWVSSIRSHWHRDLTGEGADPSWWEAEEGEGPETGRCWALGDRARRP